MASTINGYEGTGRSLSLKLLQQLREMSRPSSALGVNNGASNDDGQTKSSTSGSSLLNVVRSLKEIKLSTPIRYAPGDSIEKWLNSLLCLDATIAVPSKKTLQGCPHPSNCELFYVNRDTLFSYHPASEVFLQRMMSLYVASHYKNSPNDLQLMSDAPGHHLFVLLPPLKEGDNTLPDPLVVVQVSSSSLCLPASSRLTSSLTLSRRSHSRVTSRNSRYSTIYREARWLEEILFLGPSLNNTKTTISLLFLELGSFASLFIPITQRLVSLLPASESVQRMS